MTISERDIRRYEARKALCNLKARDNFKVFSQMVKPATHLTQLHHVYYTLLDRFAKGQIRRLIIQCQPQIGKSEGSSRLLPAFILGINPDCKIGLGSYSTPMARDFCRDVQRIIDQQEYADIFPQTRLNSRNIVTTSSYLRNADCFEVVDHKGLMRVVGRGGGLTGKSIDIMIMDDIYKDFAEANSPVIREGAWKWYTTVVRTRLHNDSQELIVFTRWHEDDIVGRLEKSGETIIDAKTWQDIEDVPHDAWVRINFEAIKESEPTELDSRQIGEVVWPEKHSKEQLLAQRAIDAQQFECLYQGHPSSAEMRMYGSFKTYIEPHEYGTYIRSGCYIDVADEGTDYLACASYDIYQGSEQYYDEQRKRFMPMLFALITDIEYTDASTEVTTISVPQLINRNRTQMVWCESNNGGSQFYKTIRPKVRATITPFYQAGNKESRITTSASLVSQSIIFPFGWESRWPKAYEHLSTFHRNFKANKHDDIEDCLAGIYEKEIADCNTMPYINRSKGVHVR